MTKKGLTEAQELDLIRRAQAGDTLAEEALIRAFMPAIRSVASMMAQRARAAGAGGVTQDEMLSDAMGSALTAIRAYRPGLGARLGSYILQRGRWYVGEGGITHVVSSGRVEEVTYETEVDTTSSVGMNPETVAGDRMLLRSVMSEIDAMPGRAAEVIRSHMLDGLTFREIGEKLGVSTQRAAKILEDAMRDLRSRLGDRLSDISST